MSVLAKRRKFISTTAGAIGLQIVPRHVLGGPNHTAPSEKLNIAGIGIGGMGSHNLAQCAKSEQVTALCDVDHKYAGGVMNRYPDAKRFHDYRELLSSNVDFDAVIVATPDHTHAIISAAALLNAVELQEKSLDSIKVVVIGAGASAIACANHYVAIGVHRENISMVDSKGIVTKSRLEAGELNEYKAPFAHDRDCLLYTSPSPRDRG